MRHAIRPDSIQPWTVDFDHTSSRYEIRRVVSEYNHQFDSGKLPDELRQKLRLIARGMLEQLGERT